MKEGDNKTVAASRSKRVNVRTPDVMERVQAEVAKHYRSEVVDKLRARQDGLTIGNTTVRLTKQFGFCYGVERAIDLAYATRNVFADNDVYLIGEIIHNQEVNRQLAEMGVCPLPGDNAVEEIDKLGPDDVVIVPAFGADTPTMNKIRERGCHVIDTTCGDVMSVWKRVRKYAKDGRTSIIHGKSSHEETRATASRAEGKDGKGNYLVALTLDDCDYVCDYIRAGKGDKVAFLERFKGGHSAGFDPDIHLSRIGVANQTTMLKSETEEMQRRLATAIRERDEDRGDTEGENFQVFDTICGATQERQDALFEMLEDQPDLLLVVGGYNSSNTAHLVEIGEKELPTFFIREAACLKSLEEVLHFDLHQKEEITSYSQMLLGDGPVVIGITAGASCPNNLIEDTILKVFKLRGVDESEASK